MRAHPITNAWAPCMWTCTQVFALQTSDCIEALFSKIMIQPRTKVQGKDKGLPTGACRQRDACKLQMRVTGALDHDKHTHAVMRMPMRRIARCAHHSAHKCEPHEVRHPMCWRRALTHCMIHGAERMRLGTTNEACCGVALSKPLDIPLSTPYGIASGAQNRTPLGTPLSAPLGTTCGTPFGTSLGACRSVHAARHIARMPRLARTCADTC